MADYHETFGDNPLAATPAYYVACRYCGADMYGRGRPHDNACPRSDRACTRCHVRYLPNVKADFCPRCSAPLTSLGNGAWPLLDVDARKPRVVV